MAMYRGKTKTGRLYSVLYQYFLSKPVGMQFQRKDVSEDLIRLYSKMYPNQTPYTDPTSFMDAITTLTKYNGPFRYINSDKTIYEFFRKFRPLSDDKVLQQNYFKVDKKGRKYEDLKEKQNKGMLKSKKKDITASLTQLGSANTKYIYNDPSLKLLETFRNQYPNRNYITEFVFTEFSSLCPKTGQPDFATIKVQYIPDKKCIETKSLKLYFLAFRQYGSFMETITNKILEDCVLVCRPKWMKVIANFNVRGGTLINVEAAHETN